MNAQMNFIGLKVYLNVNFPICLRVMSKFFFWLLSETVITLVQNDVENEKLS